MNQVTVMRRRIHACHMRRRVHELRHGDEPVMREKALLGTVPYYGSDRHVMNESGAAR